MSSARSVSRLLGWGVVIALSCAVVAYRFSTSEPLETDFLALLPEAESDAVEQAAQDQLVSAMEGRILFLVGTDTARGTAEAADQLTAQLAENVLFRDTNEFRGDAEESRFAALYPYRFHLLSEVSREALAARATDLIRAAKERVYGPLGSVALQQISSDPLGLFAGYASNFIPAGLDLYEGRLPMVRARETYWGIVPVRFAHSGFDLAALANLRAYVATLRTSLFDDGVELVASGIPLFAADGSDRAQGDVSTIGLGSLLTIAVLLLVVFRSPLPLILSFATVFIGIAIAMAVSLLMFERLHLLTLVFGASLVGVSIDYSLHYLSDGLRDLRWTPEEGVAHIFTATSLGVLTTIVAYGSIGLAPFPALRQIAVFSIAGLLGAWTSVVYLLPALVRPWRRSPPLAMSWALEFTRRFPAVPTTGVCAIALAAAAWIAIFIATAAPNDDVRRLQSATPALIEEAERMAEIVPVHRDTQFILVRAKNVETLLRREHAVAQALDSFVAAGRLSDYSALSRAYPSPSAQRANYRLLKDQLYDTGSIDGLFESVHLRSEIRDRHIGEFRRREGHEIDLETWLAIVGEPWQTLWLGCTDTCASMITLSGFARASPGDLALVSSLPGASIVDRVAVISGILARHRVVAARLLSGALVLIALFMWWRFGTTAAIRVVTPPLCSVAVTLGVMYVADITVNLFTVFGLVLVVGLGFDYSIFHNLKGRDDGPSALGILLSALTTLLSFGLMALSSTSVVSDFGIVLAVGTTASYLLSPLASDRPIEER